MSKGNKNPAISTKKTTEKNKTILIVDDHEDDLKSMSQILEKEGYDVLLCNGGTRALETLGQNNVDIILMDIMMPILSGYDLLKILRERLAQDIPIVFVSVKSPKEVDLTRVDGFVQKPFSPSALVNQVNNLIVKSKNKE